jgi:hypothetical protein
MGLRQTAPGYATFTVKPKLGGLLHASITVPTIKGLINITAAPDVVQVGVPCNTIAVLCMPYNQAYLRPRDLRHYQHQHTSSDWRLLLDGAAVEMVYSAGHLCTASGVGCGSGGKPRVLRTKRLS